MIVKRLQYVREWLCRSECAKLLDYAGLFLFLFCISHLLGMREHTGLISGTAPADKLKLFYGMMYVVTYTASVVLVPILLIASVLLELKCRLCKGGVSTRGIKAFVWLFSLPMFSTYLFAAPVTHTDVIEIPDQPRPGYLESYIDPVFGSRVTRITGDPGAPIENTGGAWHEVARHHYSKDPAWNCDQSLLLLSKHHGFPSKLFLDGSTFKPLFGRNTSPGTDMRWHPKRASIMVYVNENVIGLWDVRNESTEVVAEFEGYSKFSIGPWEGNLSLDGRYIAVEGFKDQDHVAFVYDIESRKKYSDLNLNDVTVDWVSVSASGRYLVLNGKVEGERGDQTQVYDIEGKKVGGLWPEYGRPSHYDLTVDLNGDDVAVGVSKSKPDDGRVIKRRLSDGKVTVLTPGGYASHTSTRNIKRPGWAYVTYQYRGDAWPPYRDEVVAVKLDGSMTVERIAHMHTKRVDYLTEAHAVPSPDGSMVLWAGAWEAENGRPLGAYVAAYSFLGADEMLTTPVMTDEAPAAGRRVRQTAPEYKGTEVYHALYLPVDWKPGGKYPVIVEYTGNKYPACGSTGRVCDANMGYGMSGGKGFIWVAMPYVEKGGKENAVTWWGDRDATVAYCKINLPRICEEFGGDMDNLFVCGFSRGAIGSSYIGLADDEIASLWKGMFTHDHFDGERKWGYPESDRASALKRLARLKGRPVLICGTNASTVRNGYLKDCLDLADFRFLDVPVSKIFKIPEGKVIHPHTDLWMHKESDERSAAREWILEVISEKR